MEIWDITPNIAEPQCVWLFVPRLAYELYYFKILIPSNSAQNCTKLEYIQLKKYFC